MMIGERNHRHSQHTFGPAAIQVPPWPLHDDPPSPYPVSGTSPGSGDLSPYLLGALQRFLPSNEAYLPDDTEDGSDFADAAVDAYSCDEFRMYEFKVRRCARGRSHDWTECPYAHPGEKARRRDPRKFHYSGTACPDFRKGSCKKGDACEFAHGVFECWLHPARYRTQPCKDGVGCRRRVCFFAHTPEQLRVLPAQHSPRMAVAVSGGVDSYDGSPMRQQHRQQYFMSSSPTSTLVTPPVSPPSDSPPLSPSDGLNDLLVSLRQLRLNKVAKTSSLSSSSWGVGSPRMGFVPANPTTVAAGVFGGGTVGLMDGWDEPVERVESGRDLRAMMAEKLCKENGIGKPDYGVAAAPDVDWVSDLVM